MTDAAGFERFERVGSEIVFEAVDGGQPQPFDNRLARARFLPLMDRAAAAATRAGRDIDDIACERWVEIGSSVKGPWRLAPLEAAAGINPPPPYMRSLRLRGTISLLCG